MEPHARGRAAVVAQDPYLHPQRSFVVQLRQSADRFLRRTRFRERSVRNSYHLLQIDVRHWRRRNLLIELPPCGGHVAGGPRAHRAREAAKDQTWAEIIVVAKSEWFQVTLFLNSEEDGILTDGALSSRSCTPDELCARIAAH